MNAKALLIPIAALALSATGVSAFNSDMLHKAGLTEEQISAFETAYELKKNGEQNAARDVILKANIDLHTLEAMRDTIHARRNEMRTAIEKAIETDDFEAFTEAVAGSPLVDIVTTKEDFMLFKEAHELHKGGEMEKAKDILDELGFEEHHEGHTFLH